MPEELVLKDSGSRNVYPSGAQRDNREGKGRFDLVSVYGLSPVTSSAQADSTSELLRFL